MKNKLLVLIAAGALASCSNQKTLIQRSAVCITNETETQVWFRQCETTKVVVQAWREGLYGPALVQVVSDQEFRQLEKRASVQLKNN